MVTSQYTGCSMKKIQVLLVMVIACLIGSAICVVEGESLKGGNHVCPYMGYKKFQRYTSCGVWNLRRCSRYQTVTTTLYRCCSGWKSADGTNCNIPLCAGKSDPNACNINEGYVKYKDGRIVQNSGGTCVGANSCANCNEGYYPDSGSCRFCRINNCNIPRCTNANDAFCEYCEGEYDPEYGTYAYTRFRDGGKTCRQACSWRKGSRCFPGNCSDTTIASCKCVNGYSGPDCDQIIHAASIQVNQLRLFAGSEIVKSPPNISNSDFQPTTWTNLKSSNMRANVTLQGHFMTEFENYTSPKYIINSTVGISYGKLQLDLYRADGDRVNTSYIQECNPGIDDPTPDNFTCEGTFTLNDWQPLKHQDRIQFTVEVRNGGHVLFVNYDNSMQEEKYSLMGVTKQSSFNIVFDYQEPVHCRELVGNCSSEPLTVPDVTNEPFIQVSWDEWHDNDSGILKYEIEVFHLIPDGTVSDLTQLKHGDKVSGTPEHLNSSASKANISLKTADAYSVLLFVFDKAGNTKSTRRIFIFDNISSVEKMNNPSKVTSASKETNFRWITKLCKKVHVEWHSRFANKAYERNGWLNTVEKLYQVTSVLDDNEGKRQISRTDNIHGIVRFDVGYETMYQGHITRVPFKRIQDIHNESADIIEDIVDGKRMVIYVMAFDIMDNFSEDIVNVTIDTSPPVIENLRFTWDDGANISMSSFGEFANLTIEWLAYDTHSGINYIQWRLYDNYTGQTVVRGLNNLSLQEELSDKEKCKAKYINYSRGDHCYCTPFDGCYHKHSVLKSRMSPGLNDQKRGLENGDQVQNGDYFFEVEVESKAKLKTTLTLKTAGPFIVYSTSPEFSIERNVTVLDDHFTSDATTDTMTNTKQTVLIVSVVLACLAACIITVVVLVIRSRKRLRRGRKNENSQTDPNINDIGLCKLKKNDGVSVVKTDTSGNKRCNYEDLNYSTPSTPEYEVLSKGKLVLQDGASIETESTDTHFHDLAFSAPEYEVVSKGVSNAQDKNRGKKPDIYEVLNRNTSSKPEYEELAIGSKRQPTSGSNIYSNMVLNNAKNEH